MAGRNSVEPENRFPGEKDRLVRVAHHAPDAAPDGAQGLAGVKPSIPRPAAPLSICCFSPATRTSKNSSRLEPVMQKNLSRSSRGLAGSRASLRTRWLNSSQLNSRLMKWAGSKCWTDAGICDMRTLVTVTGNTFKR